MKKKKSTEAGPKPSKTRSEELANNQRRWTRSDLEHYTKMMEQLKKLKKAPVKAGPPAYNTLPGFDREEKKISSKQLIKLKKAVNNNKQSIIKNLVQVSL